MSAIELFTIDAALEPPCQIPYWQVDSGRSGAHLLITSTMHGNELQGAEIIRRLVSICGSSLSQGKCTLVPFANPIALQRHQPHIHFELGRYYGSDREENINTTWPGDPQGNATHRLADALFKQLVPDATCLIDLHCWAAAATSVLIHDHHPPSAELARAGQFPFVHRIAPPADPALGPIRPSTLNHYFVQTNRPAITVEFDGQYIVKEHEVQRGVRCLVRCLANLRMLPSNQIGFENEPQVWMDEAIKTIVSAPHSGLFVAEPEIITSQHVEKGQKLGHIFSEVTLATTDIFSPSAGYLYTLGRRDPAKHGDEFEMKYYHPYVQAGGSVATIVA